MSKILERKPLDISYRGLLRVAIPISLGSFVQFIVTFTDNAFLGKVGMNVMNGAGLGSMLFVTLIMLGIGLASGAQIIIARRMGQDLKADIGYVFTNTFLLALILGLALFIVMRLTMEPLFAFLVESAEVRGYMEQYMQIRFIGLIVYMPALVLAALYMGLGRTRVLIYSTLITAIINLGLDWALIFGHWGAPALGIRGAAIATLIAEIANLIFLFVYTLKSRTWKEFYIGQAFAKWAFGQTRKILRLSAPIMGQQVVALATWTVFFMFIEKLGEQELMSGQIIRFMYMMVFVSIMGMAQSTKTFVSGMIAEERQSQLSLLLKRLVILNIGGMLLLSHGMLLYPDAISGIFTENEHVKFLTRKSMLTVYPALLIACFSSILLNTVEGSGKTRFAAAIEIIASVCYLGLTYYVAVLHPQPIYLVWMNDYLYFGIIVLMCAVFLRFSNWKYVKV